MKPEAHEKIYAILLDVQKQLGAVSRETGEQTRSLTELNNKVSIANGRTGKNEGRIENLELWRSYLLGAFAVASAVGVYLIHSYKSDITNEVSQKVITILEDKYDVQVK